MKLPLQRWLGAFGAIAGLAVLAGWWLDVPLLTTVLPGWPSTKPHTALASVLAGISTCLLRDERGQPAGVTLRRLGLGGALLVGLIGAVSIAEHLGAPGDIAVPGRMSLVTAVACTLLGGALALLHLERATYFGQVLLLIVAALFAPVLLSDFYGLGNRELGQLRSYGPFATLAIPTTLAFLVVSAGALDAPARSGFFQVATRGDLGGQTIRRVFPLAFGALFVAAALSAWGLRRGYFDSSDSASLIVVAGSLVLGTILWRNARRLNRTEAEIHTLHANLEEMVRQRTARLHDSEQRFASLFDLAPDAMIMTDRLGIITLANRQTETLFGWSRAELVGEPIEMLMPQPARASHVTLRQRYLQSAIPRTMGSATSDLRAVRKDGSVFSVDISLSPIESKDGLMVVAAVRDLSERKRIEHALRESEQRYRLLVENASEIFYRILTPGDPLSGTVVFVSESATALTGHGTDDFIRDPALWASLLHPDDLPLVIESTRDMLASAAPRTRSYRILAADGSHRWMEDQVKPVLDGRGAVVGYEGVARDVTDRKELEVRLASSQRLDSIGQLAGGVAHDFNNLLTVIIGIADLALVDLNEHEPIQADLREIRIAADRAAGLTRQLLAFSRRQILQPKVLDLNAVVADFLDMLRRLIGERVQITFTPAADLDPVRADPGQIEQVLANLVINARDAMPDGGMIAIETYNTLLDEGYVAMHPSSTPGPHVVLVVSDTGAGMDETTRMKIFEPFFTTKGAGKGTGLGLATVYGIVKQSGGSIWVYSEPGSGSSFKIYLPRAAKSERVEPIAATSLATSGTETILVVEDESALRQLATRILESAGYRVLVAASSDEALALLEHHRGPVDLLFTDIVMPGLSGHAMANQILTLRPALKVLYTSGYTHNAIVHHGVLDEGTCFIGKPYTAAQLREAIRRVLDSTA